MAINISKTSTGALEPHTMVEFLLENAASPDTSDILKQIIQEDLQSEEKQQMRDGINYYCGNHDILKKKRYYFDKNKVKRVDNTKENSRPVNNFHALLVDEKVSYMLGHRPAFKVDENDQLLESLDETFNKRFFDILKELAENASNMGRAYLYVFMNENEQFDYSVFDSREIIAIRDTTPQRNLTDVIRYYTIERVTRNSAGDLNKEERLKIEWYKPEAVTFFAENDSNQLALDEDHPINPFPYRVKVREQVDGDTEILSGEPWGGDDPKIPIIEIKNNNQCQTDLERIRKLQDAYNSIEAGFFDNLSDIQEVLKVVKGFIGADAAELSENFRFFKLVGVDENGGIDTVQVEIPHQARKYALDQLKEDIYEFGQGVNKDKDKIGNPSGVALQFMYAGLDMKANKLIDSFKEFLGELMFFFTDHLRFVGVGEFDPAAIEWTFNKTMIFNEAEKILSVRNSTGVTSRKTNLANHPWVDDVEGEIEQIETEREAEAVSLESFVQPAALPTEGERQ